MLSLLAIIAFSIAAIFGCLTIHYFVEALSPRRYSNHALNDMIAFHRGLNDAIVQESSKE